jgi:polysaccharide biosynthesis/export protein
MVASELSRTARSRGRLSKRFAVMCLAATVLAGCAGQTGYLKDMPASSGTALPAPSLQDVTLGGLDAGYRIGAMDKLDVRILGFPDFNTEAQVDFAGRVQLPLVGDVMAAGLTPAELNEVLTRAYDDTYLRRPQVSVTVKEVRSRLVSIEGEVKRPGMFPMPGNLTLSRALALAEGPGEFASLDRVAVFRRVDGQQMAAIFDVQDIRLGKYDDPQIYPNDVIVVGSSSVRRLFRDIIQIAPFIAVFRPFG